MRARIPISNKVKKMVHEEAKKEYEKQCNDATRRVFKLFCVALNQMHGFGQKRILGTIQCVEDLSVESQRDEVFWSHVDRIVVEKIGINFEKEDYELMDR